MRLTPGVAARMTGWLRLSVAVLALAGLLVAAPVAAQTASPAPATQPALSQPVTPPAPMTTQAYQGLTCIVLGVITTVGVFIYSDVITEVLTGATVNPVLLIPVMALGFASGCSVGSTMGPGVQWISERFR